MDLRASLKLYLLTALAAVAALAAVEGAVRAREASTRERLAASVPAMLQGLSGSTIEGREIGNQMLVHNMELFARHPNPGQVETAFVGTSRTKVLRPAWMGLPRAVNSSGNSYNEISYGLLLQAEVARLRFPNLKRVYVESSLLLRRPNRLILEPDHRKYLPMLEALVPLRAQLPGGERFAAELQQAKQPPRSQLWPPRVLAQRSEMRLSKLLPVGKPQRIAVGEDLLFTQLDTSGERTLAPPAVIPRAQQRPEIGKDNVKVQRLRDIPEWAPWDGLFDMVALWGRTHGLEVVLFQPPVRSDLYRFKQDVGMAAHVADLQRVARQYGIPFLDLNRPDLGYSSDWSLFSDEDHLETCAGVVVFHAALDAGYQQFRQKGELLPSISLAQASTLAASRLRQCAALGDTNRLQ